MAKRRTHSSIDRLPKELKDTLMRMVVDNEYPYDYQGEQDGAPTYDDMVEYCRRQGHKTSRSAIGRWAMTMRTIGRMKQAGVITREIMADINDEKASQSQKAVVEMITAVAIEFVASNEDFSAKDIKDVAKAMKDCTLVAINSDKYVRDTYAKKIEAAAKSTESKLTKAGVDHKLIQEIMDEHLGITK